MRQPTSPLVPLPTVPQTIDSMPVVQGTTSTIPGATMGGIFGNALQALWSHRQRSLLTMLGIIIGISAFVAVVCLTQGATDSILSRYNFLATIITVSPSRGSVTTAAPFTFTTGDIAAVSKVSHVVSSSPTMSSPETIISGKQAWNTAVMGVSSSYQRMYGQIMLMDRGTWWNESQEQTRRPVIVLGDTVAKNLFPNADPIGQTIRIGPQLYRVIGVLKQGGDFSVDDMVYVPYTRVLDPTNPKQIQNIVVQADNVENISLVQTELQILMEQRHRIQPHMRNSFEVVASLSELQQGEQQLSILTTLMIGIATISLIVGGVGIMNIMLVSVTERTREIGLRAALGAQPWDICSQFLLEALVLSLIGGAIGLTFGLLLGFGITSVAGLAFILSPASFMLGFGIATAIGVGFGLYPAIRASRLDPIVALRSA